MGYGFGCPSDVAYKGYNAFFSVGVVTAFSTHPENRSIESVVKVSIVAIFMTIFFDVYTKVGKISLTLSRYLVY